MNILVFGDSITQGFYDTEKGGWCNRLSMYAMEEDIASDYELDASLFNLGISGDNSEDLLKRFAREVEARTEETEETIIVFAIGVNDSQYEMKTGNNRVSLADFKKNVTLLIDRAKKYTEHIFALGVVPIDESELTPIPWKPTHGYSKEHIEKYNATLEECAAEKNIHFITMDNVFGSDPAPCLSDGIHPNAEGHKLIFERVKETLKRENML